MTDTAASSKLILNTDQVHQKIIRIAYEIYERNFEEKQLIVAGVVDRGYWLAERIAQQLDQISLFTFASQSLHLSRVSLQKFTDRQANVSIDFDNEQLTGKSIVLVDDVLNTGKTLAYCVSPFLKYPIKKIETAVLINRSHIQFPVMANYTGYELATTLQEHIEVVLDEGQEAVYLK